MSVTGTNIALTLRQIKGSELTYAELDDNQSGLKTAVESHSHDEFAPTSHGHSYGDIADRPSIPSVAGLLDDVAHDALDHSGLPGIPSVSGLLNETAHDLLDHTGLTGIPVAYTLPTASTTVLGGVRVDGTTVTIADGVISSSGSGMPNPMTAAGDIIVGGTNGAPTRLAKGTDGHVLTLASGLPSWAAASGGSLLVAETVVSGSAVTGITFNSLDGDTHGGYVMVLKAVVSAAYMNGSIYVNNDQTATNYYSQYCTANGGTFSGANANAPYICNSPSGGVVFTVINIDRVNGYFYAHSIANYGAGTGLYSTTWMAHKAATTTNITRLDFVSTQANGLLVGTVASLYRRK